MRYLIALLFLLLAGAAQAQTGSPLPSGYFSVSGNQIQSSNGTNVRLACVGYNVPTGNYNSDMTIIRSAGFNCARYPWYDKQQCPGGTCNFTTPDAIVSAAAANNVRIIFDHHGNEATPGNCLSQQTNGLWIDLGPGTNGTDGCGTAGTVNYATFKNNWVQFASHYNGNTTVIGFDLHNEPTTYGNPYCCSLTGVTWGDGSATDIRAMASDVGAAILAANPGVLIIVEGPINNGTLYNGAANTVNLIQDLTKAATNPVTGAPGKVVYSVHDYACHLSNQCPDNGTTKINAMTTAWGFLVANNTAPVWLGEMGQSLDNTDGFLTQDQAWAQTLTDYLNGKDGAFGGPTFSGTQQPMSSDWWTFGYLPGQAPDGILNSDNSLKAGQKTYWQTLLYTPSAAPPVVTATTWNPSDVSAGITLSSGNMVATSTTSTSSNSVRSTTSKFNGKACFEITANTITANWDVGLANVSYSLSLIGGLGSDANGLGFDPLSAGGTNGVFLNNAILSSGTGTSVNGEKATLCQDFDNAKFWVTTSAMRAAGYPWNNNTGANPSTGVGGISTTGLNCGGGCFITFNELDNGGVATLNTAGPFAVAAPTGFSSWDTAAQVGHPFLINIGQ